MTISITLPPGTGGGSLLRAEERLMEAVNAAGRAAMSELLPRFDSQGEALLHEGRKWTTKGKVSKIYETPWGEVMVERHVYQTSAGGSTWSPLEERARITGGTATPHLARTLSHKYANGNARAVVRDLEENHGRKLAPSYVADIAAAVAQAAGEPVVEKRAHAPQSPRRAVKTLVLGLDGTCALFCEECFKQCMVGTITLYDAAGERLETIYLAEAPEAGKATFLERLDREWQRVCAHYPEAHRAGLSDGARDYEPWLAARTTWQILDFYHASGYLAGAAAGMHRGQAERAAWLEVQCHALKHESGAAERLAREMLAQAEAGSRTRSAQAALEAAAGYFAHNHQRMKYPLCDALRMPIGSGVTEAACKTLVKARLCGSGMKWTREGAQTVLTLRALLLSTSRWASLWKHLDVHGV
jgi:hypothetical protein